MSDLDWPEAALLAALIRDPRDYDPFTNPALAIERRHLALQRLVETGNLTQGEADLYSFTPLPTAPSQIAEPPKDYFVEQVKQQLLDDPSFNLGSDYTERYNAVFEGGLRIYTTLDPALQLQAVAARNDTLPGQDPNGLFVINGGRRDVAQDCPALNDGDGHCLGTIAMVSVDPATGAVRDLVGGPGFDKWKYDLATQATRQPGSSMKAFVLAAALENGIARHRHDQRQRRARSRIPAARRTRTRRRARAGPRRSSSRLAELGELRVPAPRSDRRHRQGHRPGPQDGRHVAAEERRVVPARRQLRVAARDGRRVRGDRQRRRLQPAVLHRQDHRRERQGHLPAHSRRRRG